MKTTIKTADFQLQPIATTPEERQHHIGQDRPSSSPRSAAHAWISDKLIDQARQVWIKEYGRILTDAEAVEILSNFKRLAEVLLKAKAEANQRNEK